MSKVIGRWFTQSPFVPVEMDYFDKRMALEIIEDAFTSMGTPEAKGLAVGLCSAFYMCGLLDEGEWQALLTRIPARNSHVR